MDGIGWAMGTVTIPMALLSVAAPLGGLWLLGTGGIPIVVAGLAATIAGMLLAHPLERGVAWLDEVAVAMRAEAGPLAGHLAGFVCAVVPMAAVLGWEYGAFRLIVVGEAGHGPLAARWLWSYGVATWPWTLFAVRVGSDRRTLCGIRAYAGHLGYWLLSAAWFAGAPVEAAGWTMALPAILPLTVGTLLAVADRDALRNVRI